MPNLNKTAIRIRLPAALESVILDTVTPPFQKSGELAFSSDTFKVFVSDGEKFIPIGGSSSTLKYDSTSSYSYCGVAPAGSLDDAEVWQITRIDKSDLSTSVAVDITWNDRLTTTYV